MLLFYNLPQPRSTLDIMLDACNILLAAGRDQDSENKSPLHDGETNERISPFLPYTQDGYVFPDLYTELDEMLECCTLIYPLVELRRKARTGIVDESILKLPMSHSKLWDIVNAHREQLLDTKFATEFYLQTLQAAESRSFFSPTSIVACDDEFEQEELVYTVEVHEARQRVTVCFRGSVTNTDWATDYQVYMKQVPNPLASHASQEEFIRFHNGFHDYLLETNSRGAKGANGEDLSEYQEILYHHVLPVLRKYPGYKLYVTGHSLGAALATLFGFYAATEADEVIPKPVSLFSIAGPYAGDASFRAAHQLLEAHGKLRHLRVSNHKDVVTIVPKMSFKFNIFDSTAHVFALFKHVGVHIRMFEDETTPMEISYPRVRTGYWQSTVEELSRGWEQSLPANWSWNPTDLVKWPAHSLKEYGQRMDANKPVLSATQLNSLYERKDIVGNLVAGF